LRIFLSYRREDGAAYAGRISDRLTSEFGRNSLFMDVDGIPLGVDFAKRLSQEVAGCDVLLAVIGGRWSDLRDGNGNRRLDDPRDFVRIEIREALNRAKPVIPILLDGIAVPGSDSLPDDIKALAVQNGLSLRHATFHADLDRLVRELKRPTILGQSRPMLLLFSLAACIAGYVTSWAAQKAVIWIVGKLLTLFNPAGDEGFLPANMWKGIDILIWYHIVMIIGVATASLFLLRNFQKWFWLKLGAAAGFISLSIVFAAVTKLGVPGNLSDVALYVTALCIIPVVLVVLKVIVLLGQRLRLGR